VRPGKTTASGAGSDFQKLSPRKTATATVTTRVRDFYEGDGSTTCCADHRQDRMANRFTQRRPRADHLAQVVRKRHRITGVFTSPGCNQRSNHRIEIVTIADPIPKNENPSIPGKAKATLNRANRQPTGQPRAHQNRRRRFCKTQQAIMFQPPSVALATWRLSEVP